MQRKKAKTRKALRFAGFGTLRKVCHKPGSVLLRGIADRAGRPFRYF